MEKSTATREELLEKYYASLPYPPYPVQEDALFSYFSSEQGVLVCAPTGTGKTLIAEAALFEALHTGTVAYYTTPLIALTEQKFTEIQASAERWGFSKEDVGLVTGNRRVNPQAKILVVVAEILLNRLLNTEGFDFSNVSAVVMDEFHSFADPERGIVWELSLGLLPAHVRLLLLSATVGNAFPFTQWLRESHQRDIELVQGTERKVPLSFHYIEDELLNEHITFMATGSVEERKTPCLIFCFNRDACWDVAEQLKGKDLLQPGQQEALKIALDSHDFSNGVGPKLKRLLMRGVGVHHAGMLPKHRRLVEQLYEQKLLSVATCTETLAAGINLPARSVVLPSLLKGPPGRQKLVDSSSAHQIFGRAGRPQFDTEGNVYALAHEDDVKIARWKVKYDQIPEDTKDPNLRKAKKQLKKKKPTRRENQQYWNAEQFEKLRNAPSENLSSRGPLPWRLLAYLLRASPEVDLIREMIGKRLMSDKKIEQGEKELDRMLLTLWEGGFVNLEPSPPKPKESPVVTTENNQEAEQEEEPAPPPEKGLFAGVEGIEVPSVKKAEEKRKQAAESGESDPQQALRDYRAEKAIATEDLDSLLLFRSVNPLYGVFLVETLGTADRTERIQALESVLEVPRNMLKALRVPAPDELPPGPLATGWLNEEVLQRGLYTHNELTVGREIELEERTILIPPPPLGDKLAALFGHEYPRVDVRTNSIWVVGELLTFGGNFYKLISSKNLSKQEGIVFRHLLRFILLCNEFSLISPPDCSPEDWQSELKEISEQVAEACRQVDSQSTDEVLEDAVSGEVLREELGLRHLNEQASAERLEHKESHLKGHSSGGHWDDLLAQLNQQDEQKSEETEP
ncbi:DNA synthesis and replication [Planctomycetales bacterium 10988]|nr:DNA synthesis and replication [Planctomycetales bacterium 10988]